MFLNLMRRIDRFILFVLKAYLVVVENLFIFNLLFKPHFL